MKTAGPSAGGAARSAWVTARGAWLVLLAAYALAWALWLPLLGRDLGNVAAVPADFLVPALAGNIMPAVGVLAWRALGGRVPAAAREDVASPSRFPLRLAGTLAVVPVLTLAAIGIQAAFGLAYSFGNVTSRLAIGMAWPLVAAFGEEDAWRGTVLPLLRMRLGLLEAALVIGLLWGFWHLPADWIGLKSQGSWFWPQFFLQGPILLTAHSVIMTWIWAKSGGRTIAAVVYHFGITSSAILLGNQVKFADPLFSFLGNVTGVAVVVCVAAAAGIRPLAERPCAVTGSGVRLAVVVRGTPAGIE
jgi:membrane protease YdiL (CAAX protease family)